MIAKFLRKLGISDCLKGRSARIKLKAYLDGYGYQYELGEKQDAI